MWLNEKDGKIFVKVRIQPNSKKFQIVGLLGDELKIKVNAPAIEGRANEKLIEGLSKILKVAKKSIKILKGELSKSKLIQIEGLTKEEVEKCFLK